MEVGSTYSSVTIGCSVLMEVFSTCMIIIIIIMVMMMIIILSLLLLNFYCRKHLHEFQARSVDE